MLSRFLPWRPKRAVVYTAVSVCEVGRSAELYCVDHPKHPGKVSFARTSAVRYYDARTGIIQTRNTRYVPASNLKPTSAIRVA